MIEKFKEILRLDIIKERERELWNKVVNSWEFSEFFGEFWKLERKHTESY